MSYTNVQEARLREEAPVTYARAGELATEFDVSRQSVISKLAHMKLEYIKKEVPTKRPTPLTKAQLVDLISYRLDGVNVAGLEGATLASLNNLHEAL